MDPTHALIAMVIGLMTGGLTSLIGASGVTIVVPALTMIYGAGIHTAIGTSLFVDVVASVAVAISYFRNGRIEMRSAIAMTVASMIGAQLGASLAGSMGDSGLASAFGGFLVLAGLILLWKNRRTKAESTKGDGRPVRFKTPWIKTVITLVLGLGIGMVSGIFGAGGGVLVLMSLVAVLSFPLHVAIGTSTLIMALTALSSTIGYAARGNIDFVLGGFLAAGAVVGGIIGSRYANSVNERTLRFVVSICFIAIGIVMTALMLAR